MLHVDVLGAVLALGILFQHNTGFIIAVQNHADDGLGYHLEVIEKMS